MMETILITGASGFLGKRIVRFLQRFSDAYLLTTSRQQESFPNHLVRDLSSVTSELTSNVDTVIHFAGLSSHHKVSEQEFMQANVDNTVNIAKAAIESGVKRFIFISTTDVYGKETKDLTVLTESSAVNPQTAYARSKLAAEEALKALCANSDMNLVILRLSLIYHIDAVNEFGDYIALVKEGRPLPLDKIANQRSLLALCNFESALNAVLRNSTIVNETFILADPVPLSTTEIMKGIAVATISPVKLFYAPKLVAKIALATTGRTQLFETFWGDFQVSSKYAQDKLNWEPIESYIVNLSK